MTHRPTFEDIQKQHQEWLRQLSEVDNLDTDDPRVKGFIQGIKGFIDILAQAGTYIENADRRSLLRDFIRYWSSEINDKTGNFRIVQLQPFDLSKASGRSVLNFFRKLNRPFLLIASLSLIIILAVLLSILSSIRRPSAFYCPTLQQVSEWMNVDVSQITNVKREGCAAFTVGNKGKQLSGVVCTNQNGGTTIEYIAVSQPNILVVMSCDGKQLPNIWGPLTIRFLGGYPPGGASVCTIARNEYNKQLPLTIQPKDPNCVLSGSRF